MRMTVPGLFFVILLVAQSGCATIISGTMDEVRFTSEPPGAEVFVDRKLRGQTPLTLKLNVNYDYIVVFRMAGHPDQVQHIQHHMNMNWFSINSFTFPISLTWGIIDWITGAVYDLKPSVVHASFGRTKPAAKEK